MNKVELIKEAQEKLVAENLEKQRLKVLAEVREVERRVTQAKQILENCESAVEEQRARVAKEEKAAENYRNTGDYQSYKKELSISECPYNNFNFRLSSPSYGNEVRWHSDLGTFLQYYNYNESA